MHLKDLSFVVIQYIEKHFHLFFFVVEFKVRCVDYRFFCPVWQNTGINRRVFSFDPAGWLA